MLLLIGRLWPVVCYLVPGALLGFGFAVLPHPEALARELPPVRRVVQAAPWAALRVGWALLGGTLMAHHLLWEPSLVLGVCLLMDLAALCGLVLLVRRELPVLC